MPTALLGIVEIPLTIWDLLWFVEILRFFFVSVKLSIGIMIWIAFQCICEFPNFPLVY